MNESRNNTNTEFEKKGGCCCCSFFVGVESMIRSVCFCVCVEWFVCVCDCEVTVKPRMVAREVGSLRERQNVNGFGMRCREREREREKERCIYLGKRALFCGVSEWKKMESRKRNRTYSLRHRLDILANNWKK